MDVKCNRFTPWSKGDTRLRTLSTNCRQLVRKIALDDFKKSSFKSDEFLNNVINVIKKVGIQIETNPEATEEDVDVCYETIDYCKNKLKGFNKNSKLLDYHNDVALVSVIAYAIKNEIDLDKWIVSFSNQNNTYPSDIKENYTYMLNSLKQFTNNVAA